MIDRLQNRGPRRGGCSAPHRERCQAQRWSAAIKMLVAVVASVLVATACGAAEQPGPVGPTMLAFDGSALDRRSDGLPQMVVVAPQDGAVLRSPVQIEIAVENFALAAKGVSRDGEGHFHVIVNAPCVDAGELIGDEHVHVGDGSAGFALDLEPGRYTLCLQLGDGFHTALAIAQSVSFEVE